MLAKLLKYEIKATGRMFLPLYLTLLVFAAINRFFLAMPQIGEGSMSFKSIALVITMIVYVTLMVGLVLMTLIVLVQRFYKNLLGDEGYLMFTLPVQSWKHILSKLIVSMLWTVVSAFVAFCSIVLIASRNITIADFFEKLSIIIEPFAQFFGAYASLVILEGILIALLTLASTILTIYAAIALGHLFNKHKLLASFGMYVVLRTISQILMTLSVVAFSNLAPFKIVGNFVPSVMQINTILLLCILYLGFITAGYFALTNYLLKRKLNLE